jgi:hypothetical protein
LLRGFSVSARRRVDDECDPGARRSQAEKDRAVVFGARLDPLREALEAAGVDLKTGALRR